MDNPAIRQRGGTVRIRFYDGTAATVPGTVRRAETTAGESNQAFADAGPLAFVDFDGDAATIEYAEIPDFVTAGHRRRHRVTKRERTGSIFPVIKLNLAVDGKLLGSDWNARDWRAGDWLMG